MPEFNVGKNHHAVLIQLIDLYERRLKEIGFEDPRTGGGRRISPRGMARRLAAQDAGIDIASVDRADTRARKAAREKANAKAR